MKIEEKIKSLGIVLPQSSPPRAMYIPIKQTGNLLFISGQVPFVNGTLAYTGKVGETVNLEEAKLSARICIINMLGVLKDYLGDLDSIHSIIKIQAFVNSKSGFDQQHIVINAASQLLFDLFGENGRHARTAIGTNQLPMDAPVEIEAIIELNKKE